MWAGAKQSHSQSSISCFVQNMRKVHIFSCRRVNLAKCEILGHYKVEKKRLMSLYGSGSSSTDERIDESQITELKGFHKDLYSLPRPLSAMDRDPIGSNGSKVRVAYQGLPGTYSEIAALKAYPMCKTVPCDQIESAVELWLADKGVLPIENSVGGSIHRNYDLLLRHRLHIVGEVELVVNHYLLGLPGVRKEELTHVLSDPQALEQCQIMLNKLGVVKVSTKDTAGVPYLTPSDSNKESIMLDGIRETGAIASLQAAEIYGLDIVAQTIQDDSDNITRFLILAREPIIPIIGKPYKTSIVFTLKQGPRVLFKALAAFAHRDINLSKIDSRPQRNRPLRIVDDSNKGSPMYFDYLFYIDFEASMADPRAQLALTHLKEFATFLRILGCYPMNTVS
nr:arogenate dehydratase/prephenate dehydratase 1, chloroplastic [Tanacetum cinerariifolium]